MLTEEKAIEEIEKAGFVGDFSLLGRFDTKQISELYFDVSGKFVSITKNRIAGTILVKG